jgi:hypothetical protein
MLKLDFPVFATVSLCAGPALFFHSFRDLRTRRLMQNTPTARIRSMAMGLVEVNGTIEAHSTLSAPFSGRPCAFWQVDIAVPTSRRGSWSIIHRNASGHPFYLRDETGVAMVYPQHAACKVRFETAEECVGVAMPECYTRYMKEQGVAFRRLWRLSALRFRERILEEGQRLYVLGCAEPRARALDVSEPEVLKATGTEAYAMRRLRTLHDETVAVIRRGPNEPTFIISQESERELAMEMGLRALGKLVVGPALTLVGIGYWLLELSARTFPK